MKKLKLTCYSTILLSMLFSSLLLSEKRNCTTDLLPVEMYETLKNRDTNYVYLGKKTDKLYQLLAEISLLDDDKSSLVHQLRTHIENGLAIGEWDAVIDAFDYAKSVLRKNYKKL